MNFRKVAGRPGIYFNKKGTIFFVPRQLRNNDKILILNKNIEGTYYCDDWWYHATEGTSNNQEVTLLDLEAINATLRR